MYYKTAPQQSNWNYTKLMSALSYFLIPYFCSILHPGFYPFSIKTKQLHIKKSRLHTMD